MAKFHIEKPNPLPIFYTAQEILGKDNLKFLNEHGYLYRHLNSDREFTHQYSQVKENFCNNTIQESLARGFNFGEALMRAIAHGSTEEFVDHFGVDRNCVSLFFGNRLVYKIYPNMGFDGSIILFDRFKRQSIIKLDSKNSNNLPIHKFKRYSDCIAMAKAVISFYINSHGTNAIIKKAIAANPWYLTDSYLRRNPKISESVSQ